MAADWLTPVACGRLPKFAARSLWSVVVVSLSMSVVFVWVMSASYWHSPLGGFFGRNRLWLSRHADVISRADVTRAFPWLHNVSFANKAGLASTSPVSPHVCVGVMVYGRTERYLLSLIHSLVEGSLHSKGRSQEKEGVARREATKGSLTIPASWDPGFSLTVYWQPESERDGNESFINTLVAGAGVDVVRVDKTIQRQRAAANGSATVDGFDHCPPHSGTGLDRVEMREQQAWALHEGDTLGDASWGLDPQSRRLVLGGHMYGLVLLDMLQRQGNSACESYLVLEDDVLASWGWVESVRELSRTLDKRDPAWRAVKLFSKEFWVEGWSNHTPLLWDMYCTAVWCTLLLTCVFNLSWRVCIGPTGIPGKKEKGKVEDEVRSSGGILLPGPTVGRRSAIRWGALSVGCRSLAMAFNSMPYALHAAVDLLGGVIGITKVVGGWGLLALVMFLVGRPRIPCSWINPHACPNIEGPLQGYWPQTCTQAFLFSKGAAGPFGACLATTPIGMTCLASDHASHRCFAAPPGPGSSSFSDYARQAGCAWDKTGAHMTCNPPLPCPAEWEQCEPKTAVMHGLYESVPHLFQHVGTMNSFGKERNLLASDRWDGYRMGPATPQTLWPLAGLPW